MNKMVKQMLLEMKKKIWGLCKLCKIIFKTEIDDNNTIKIPDKYCEDEESIEFEITEDHVFLLF